ncbi:MAG: M48 family metallopeptidase [Candidatus Sabulitectum sp.]|nr:M48 family metallopeptidase [Candidatus Sabulitectum sp.]
MKRTIPYLLRYSNRAKRLRLEVVPGEVRVIAPPGISVSLIDEFVRSRENWLADKLSAFASVAPIRLPVFSEDCPELTVLGEKVFLKECFPSTKNFERTVVKWLDDKLMTFLTETLKKYAQPGLVPSRIRLGNARTRWGSCSSKGVVMINRKLVYAPPDVVEYVLVHELVHLRHRNHSRLFWNTVEHCLGDVKPQKRWLRLQGAYLL